MTLRKAVTVLLLAVAMSSLAATSAFATHFRYGTITSRVPDPAQPNQVAISISLGFRRSYPWSPSTPIVGQIISGDQLPALVVIPPNAGAPTTYSLTNFVVQSVNQAEDWFVGQANVLVTLPTNVSGIYTVQWESGDRLSTLADRNHDNSFRLRHTFTVANGVPTSGAPVLNGFPIRVAAFDRAFSFSLPGIDPDGDTLQWRLSTSEESLLTSPQPTLRDDTDAVGPIDPSFQLSATGRLSFTPTRANCNKQPAVAANLITDCMYAIQVMATDGRGATVPFDFLIHAILPVGNPPVVTINNSVQPVSVNAFVGVQTSFTVKATDTDSASLELQATNLLGMTSTPALPFSQSNSPPTPATAVVTWTPSLSDIGTRVVEVSATDLDGNQITNFITINVSTAQYRYVSGYIRDFQSTDLGFNKADGDNGIPLVLTTLDSSRKPIFNPAVTGTSTTIPGGAGFSNFFTKTPAEVFSINANNGASLDPNIFSYAASDFRGGDKFFTYELHTYFTYSPGQVLHYSSSDDLWIFINGRLVVDLGGVHTAPRTFTLTADNVAAQQGWVPGMTYEMDVFYAHRGNSHVPSVGLELPSVAICSAVGAPAATTLPTVLGTAQTIGAITRLSTANAGAPSSGAAFTATPKVIIGGFTAEFDFKIAPAVAGGGEGLAFVMQSTATRGSDASNLGYAGIANSVAVEFDTHLDTAQSDPSPHYDQISVHTRYGNPNSASEMVSVGRSLNIADTFRNTPFDLNNNVTHHARVVYEAPPDNPSAPAGIPTYGWLRVYLDGSYFPTAEAQLDHLQMLQTLGTAAYLGFTTGATSTPTNTTATVEVTNFTIATAQVSPAFSNLTQLPQTQLPDMTGSVLLQLRDACNVKLRIGGLASVTATLVNALNPSYTTPVTVTDMLDGTYRLSYTPRVGGTWALNVQVNNQQILNTPFPFVVLPATATISAAGASGPYTGSPRVATAVAKGVFNEAIGPVTITYNGQPSAIDAGTYTAVATYAATPFYNEVSASATVTITRVAPTVTVNNATVIYNGLERSSTGTVKGINGETLGVPTFTYAPGTPINAGMYIATGSYAGNINYIAGSSTGSLKIDAATPIVTVTDVSATFDGASHPATATVTGVNGETFGAASIVYDGVPAAPINAGVYVVKADFTAGGNYLMASGSGIVSIAKATPTVEVQSDVVTYDANPHSVTATAKGIGGIVIGTPQSITYDGSTTAPANAKTYAVIASFDALPNYVATTGTGSLTINPATPTVSVADASFTYDGNAHLATGSVAGVAGQVLGPLTFTYDGSAAAPVDAKSYHVVGSFAAVGNYASASSEATLTIDPATPTVTVNSPSFVYDGASHAATASASGIGEDALGPVTITYDGEANAPVNAKSYHVIASIAAGGNYAAASATATLDITPATPSVQITGGPFTFDGQPHAAIATITGVGGVVLGTTAAVTYNGSSNAPVNAGDYAVDAAVTAGGNYSGTSNTGSLTILKATPTVEIASATVTFDNLPHAVTGVVKGVNGVVIGTPESFTYDSIASAPTNAGIYLVGAAFSGNGNYLPAGGTGSLTINPATPVVTVNNLTFVYNGAPRTSTGVVKGVGGEVLGSLTFTYDGANAAPVNVKNYQVVGSFAGGGNYGAASGTGTLAITPASPSLSVINQSFTYDGVAHGAAATAVGIAGEVLGPVTFTYDGNNAAPTNVKSYQVVASFAAGGNYSAASANGTLIITRATPTIQIAGGPFIYDGKPHALTATVLGANGASIGNATLTYNGSATAPTKVGNYTALASYAATTNYSAASASGSLAITRAPLVVTANNLTMVEKSAVPALTASFSGFVNGETIAVLDTPALLSTTATSTSAPGSYPITVAGASDANYSVTFVPGALTITPLTITPGLMTGYGYVRDDDDRFTFEFVVRERANGSDRGYLELRILDEDRDRRGNKKAKPRPRDDRFESRTLTKVVFSDDPTVRPGRTNRPQIDTVAFEGTGQWNGKNGYRFEAFAQDIGEPGRHRESIQITIFDAQGRVVAAAEGDLDGGNIQSVRIRH